MICIDSNILIYSVDYGDEGKQQIAANTIKKCFSGKINPFLTTQILSEFFVNSTKKVETPMSQEDAKEFIESLISDKKFKIASIKPENVIQAIKLMQKFNSSYWDSLIAAVMLENGIFEIYTENVKDFERIGPIKAINPFE